MALQLATRGWYTATPNPRVGCVVVRNGQAVGCGWHERVGGAHAEVMALERAGRYSDGATAYINLEPCAHFGHTPPCCDALIRAGVARVVMAMRDPNPQVSGKGLAALRDAGVEVQEDVLKAEAQHINAGFITRHRIGRPRITLKLAMSMDGRIAMASGESRWITGEVARTEVQDMRASTCAIVTGIGTVLADDPQLNVRNAEWKPKYRKVDTPQPLVVVVDSQLRLPIKARLRSLGDKLLVAHCSSDKGEQGEQSAQDKTVLWRAPAKEGRVDLCALFGYLAVERGCNNVLVECGGNLAAALIEAQLVDEFHFYLAPVLLGATARPAVNLSLDHLRDKLNFNVIEHRPAGDDWCIRAVPVPRTTKQVG